MSDSYNEVKSIPEQILRFTDLNNSSVLIEVCADRNVSVAKKLLCCFVNWAAYRSWRGTLDDKDSNKFFFRESKASHRNLYCVLNREKI